MVQAMMMMQAALIKITISFLRCKNSFLFYFFTFFVSFLFVFSLFLRESRKHGSADNPQRRSGIQKVIINLYAIAVKH